MLSKIREVSNNSKIFNSNNITTASAEPGQSFDDILKITKMRFQMLTACKVKVIKLKNAYVAGDTNVSMSQVMLASQKSKLAFEV